MLLSLAVKISATLIRVVTRGWGTLLLGVVTPHTTLVEIFLEYMPCKIICISIFQYRVELPHEICRVHTR